MHKLRFLGPLALLTMLSTPGLATAQAVNCEICKYTFFLGYSPCHTPAENESGTTICKDVYTVLDGFHCEEDGNACGVITVHGGGSGGSGGGGSAGGTDPCATTGFCPAECFSCGGGGGGRPAV